MFEFYRDWKKNRSIKRMIRDMSIKHEISEEEYQRMIKNERSLCTDCHKKNLMIRVLVRQTAFYRETLALTGLKMESAYLMITTRDAKTFKLIPVDD